jgi:murein endopeptidase
VLKYGNSRAWLWVASAKLVIDIHMAHQEGYSVDVFLIMHKSMVHICHTRAMVQSGVKKGLSDEAMGDRSLRKCISK